MKRSFYIILLLATITCKAQNISGLYSGTLMNDSTKKVQNYELALSEYRGVITGYSYTTFVRNDTLFYSIKKVKAQKKDGELIVEDVKMLANNFPAPPAKGIHQIDIFPLNMQDSIVNLTGTWKTTKTKTYYSLSGAASMQKDKDSAQSQLVAHLTELKIINNNPPPAMVSRERSIATPAIPAIVPADQRKTNFLQSLTVNSDSITLAFYDNGIVDGDSISVLINGVSIISKQLLTANAVKKVVHLNNPADTSITITLVAESLGTLPPNTGLLTIQDAANRYQINFSADMQTNAAIVIRKKKGI